jgi:LysM repeat protein
VFATQVPASYEVTVQVTVNHPERYRVRSGDTLSSIAQHRYHHAADWACIYDANKATVSDPSLILVGQELKLPAHVSSHCVAPQAKQIPVLTAVSASPVQEQSAPVQAQSTYAGSGSMQECIITAESGGNSQIMNSSGHYGLYQFSYGTWVANGGNPADFGNASVAEQNQVFYSTVAASGYSSWTPYDGCTA